MWYYIAILIVVAGVLFVVFNKAIFKDFSTGYAISLILAVAIGFGTVAIL